MDPHKWCIDVIGWNSLEKVNVDKEIAQHLKNGDYFTNNTGQEYKVMRRHFLKDEHGFYVCRIYVCISTRDS